MIKTFKNGAKDRLSEHFTAYDFRCKCGGNHNIKVDTALVDLLEKLMKKLGADKQKSISGFRCPKHDIKVGGSGKGSHTEGKALDVKFSIGENIIPSDQVAITLENMGHKYGIGYRCGGAQNKAGTTHIDVRHRQWYGNEAVSFKRAVCKTWYNYFTIKYETMDRMNVRKGAGTNYAIVKKYDKGTIFTATAVTVKKDSVWLKCKDGYVCLEDSKHVYCKFNNIKQK